LVSEMIGLCSAGSEAFGAGTKSVAYDNSIARRFSSQFASKL